MINVAIAGMAVTTCHMPHAFFWYRALRASTGLSKHGTPSDRRFPNFQRAVQRGGGRGTTFVSLQNVTHYTPYLMPCKAPTKPCTYRLCMGSSGALPLLFFSRALTPTHPFSPAPWAPSSSLPPDVSQPPTDVDCRPLLASCSARTSDSVVQSLAIWLSHPCPTPRTRAVLKGPVFFFLAKDRPQGPPQGTTNRQPPTPANRQPPPTANHQPPPTASGDQPPTVNHCQPPPTTNHQSPTTNRRQPSPTATNRQLPTANRQPPPTANRQPPPTMVEHMECPRAFLGKLVPEHFFFFFSFSVKDRPASNPSQTIERGAALATR